MKKIIEIEEKGYGRYAIEDSFKSFGNYSNPYDDFMFNMHVKNMVNLFKSYKLHNVVWDIYRTSTVVHGVKHTEYKIIWKIVNRMPILFKRLAIREKGYRGIPYGFKNRFKKLIYNEFPDLIEDLGD